MKAAVLRKEINVLKISVDTKAYDSGKESETGPGSDAMIKAFSAVLECTRRLGDLSKNLELIKISWDNYGWKFHFVLNYTSVWNHEAPPKQEFDVWVSSSGVKTNQGELGGYIAVFQRDTAENIGNALAKAFQKVFNRRLDGLQEIRSQSAALAAAIDLT
jgi:hypothetical protein